MIPLTVLVLTPVVAQDAGLAWDFGGKVSKEARRYRLVGKELKGEVAFFKGYLSAQKLYENDTSHTKDADAARRFTHVQRPTTFAGMPAIQSDQRYLWNDVPVVSRCVYCASVDRAWVVRLWWSPASNGAKEADAFLKTVTRSPSR